MNAALQRTCRAASVGGSRLLPLLIVAAVGLAFSPALRSDFVLWDDDLNITDNPAYRGLSATHLHWMFTTLHGGHYQPLTWLTFALDHALWGLNPMGYHLTNVVLHAANAVLVYWLVWTLLERVWTPRPQPDLRVAAAAGALFFALHPLRVESVAWVTERRDVLAAGFYVLAVLAYLKMQSPGLSRELPRSRHHACYALALVSFALSLLSKAWGITFPLVLLVLDVYPLQRFRSGASRRAILWEKAPFAALASVALTLAWVAQSQVQGMLSLAQHGVASRLAQAAYGLCFYPWKTLLPLRLSPLYLLEPSGNPLEVRYVVAGAAVVGLTAMLIRFRRRWPWALSAWMVYATIVSPVLGLTQAGPQLVADRYSYLSCLPAAVLLAAAVQMALPRRGALAGVFVGLTLLGVFTYRQCGIWRDSLTLWDYTVHLDPANFFAYGNRGVAQETLRGDLAAAISDYTTAIQLNPNHATAYFDRGHAREIRGDFEGAIADYTAALRAYPQNVKAYYNRGGVREQRGDLPGAAADFARALELAPPGWAERDRIVRSLAAVRDTVRDR